MNGGFTSAYRLSDRSHDHVIFLQCSSGYCCKEGMIMKKAESKVVEVLANPEVV